VVVYTALLSVYGLLDDFRLLADPDVIRKV
jgi:hypothetical protein